MCENRIEGVAAAIAHIEAHLNERLDLDAVARAAGYSKYHLHRMFTSAAGLTPHDYIRRRRLTEAARLLVFSPQPILEIALAAGYESQQAFAAVFKSMYKRTPLEYRRRGSFYPLQLELALQPQPSAASAAGRGIAYASMADLPDWLPFISLVVDGLPCLEEASHLEQVRRHIDRGQALVMRDGAAIIGAAAFTGATGSIDLLAVHPQYRRRGVARALLDFMRRSPLAGREVSIVTFREGDRADTGQRAEYKKLGFADSELLTAFGYPAQRLILPPG